jgi:hypothetical protein
MLTALYADSQGEIYDAPGYQAVGKVGDKIVKLNVHDMIPLPEGAELMYLPGRTALMEKKGKTEPLASSLLAVAAMLPVGFTRTHLPAFVKQNEAPLLPLFGYTAAALYKDQIMVAAIPTSDNAKWHPNKYNTPALPKKVDQVKRELGPNRLVEHLANCSLEWHCCTAQNLFYRRWECGIPTSPSCNANCLGCISLQPAECCPSPQSRIVFTPTAQEIAELGIYHLSNAPDPIISFGQGCEGEPSLAASTIAAGINLIRAATGQGIININTNAGYTDGIRQIVDAGLNSMRVSIISAIPETYQAYYRTSYSLDDVRRSIHYAKEKGVYVSLNMLLFPGLNDRPEEIAAWTEFIGSTGIDMIQLRNLNLDPDWLLAVMPAARAVPIGVRPFLQHLAQVFPQVDLGSFTVYQNR